MRFTMLNAPELFVMVSVVTPVAPFLAEIFAPITAPPCASVIVPDRVAPETCARSGVAENTSPRAQINTRILVAFDFIAVPPVWYKDFSNIQHTHFPSTLGSDEACSMEWTLLLLCRREYQDERRVGR